MRNLIRRILAAFWRAMELLAQSQWYMTHPYGGTYPGPTEPPEKE